MPVEDRIDPQNQICVLLILQVRLVFTTGTSFWFLQNHLQFSPTFKQALTSIQTM